MNFSAKVTGSTSVRLSWDMEQPVIEPLVIFRGVTNSFSGAVAIASSVDFFAGLFNDYGLAPSTTYYYWLNSAGSGPISATTADLVVTADALDESQRNAIYAFLTAVFGGLYPVMWDNQPTPQPIKPRIMVAVSSVRSNGFDDVRDAGERLAGTRQGTLSVNVYSDPTPPQRALIAANPLLPAGTYSITVTASGVLVVHSVVFLTPPANGTAVTQALLAQMQTDGVVDGSAWLAGLDPNNQLLVVESPDQRSDLAITGVNVSINISTPPKALLIAQRLATSLGVQSNRDALNAAGIGTGAPGDVRDISAVLDTTGELRAQFDTPLFLASNLAVSGPIIDTVTSLDGTLSN